MPSLLKSLVGGAAIAVVALAATPALAKCTKLAFTVNDYGKDGPTKDAKALLDTYIAKWTAERGIKKYTTGKKDVTCELFLDVGFFDEHTCKAAATVCWSDGAPGAKPTEAAAPDAPAVGTPVKKSPVPAKAPAPAKVKSPA